MTKVIKKRIFALKYDVKFMKVVVISPYIQGNTGGGIINERNIDLLRTISEDTSVYYIDVKSRSKSSILRRGWELLCGYFGGVSHCALNEIIELVCEKVPDIVFVNQSLYGIVNKYLKKRFPNIVIVTFFHNVEAQYFKCLFRESKNIRSYVNYKFSRRSENLAVIYSDYLIAMNIRDAHELKRLYGKSASLLLPTSFADRGQCIPKEYVSGKALQLLFVGFNFFANLHGVSWFCREVMPFLENAHLSIVGKNMENERASLESRNVSVIGSVDSLERYYSNADVVVSPIFIGSGMKTKTAEALMHGKPIFATAEALEGYDVEVEKIGARCNNAAEFIDRINYYSKNRDCLAEMSKQSREYFKNQYSQEIAQVKLLNFLEQIIQ